MQQYLDGATIAGVAHLIIRTIVMSLAYVVAYLAYVVHFSWSLI